MSNDTSLTMHGVFIEVFSTGVLLTGNSGIGKSEVALGLIDRGHYLIADDSVDIKKGTDGRLIGSCPVVLEDFLEIRGLGIVNIARQFGRQQLKASAPLQLIIELVDLSPEELAAMDRLHGLYEKQLILEEPVAKVSIPVAPGRSIGILVEVAVRKHQLYTNGYIASEDFARRQNNLISKS